MDRGAQDIFAFGNYGNPQVGMEALEYYTNRVKAMMYNDVFLAFQQIDQRMNNPELAYNTVSNTAPGGKPGSAFFRVAQDVGTISNCYVHDNYADPRNMISVISAQPRTGVGYRKSGNVLLTSGTAF